MTMLIDPAANPLRQALWSPSRAAWLAPGGEVANPGERYDGSSSPGPEVARTTELVPAGVACLRVDQHGHPLPGQSVDGVDPEAIRQALRRGDFQAAGELTARLQKAADSGGWTVHEPDGRSYPLEVSARGRAGADLMHILRNGVVMQLALEARRDPALKQQLGAYEGLLTSLVQPRPENAPRMLLAE